MKNIKKLIATSIISMSIFAIPITANAEWKQDNVGWWYADNNSWVTGWQEINNKWYYFNPNGYIAHDTNIGGYTLDNNGVWIQNTTTNTSNTTNLNSNNVTNTNLTTNSNNILNSNNLTNNTVNNINYGTVVNGNVVVGNTVNSNNTQQSNSNNQINSNDYNKTEPIIEGKFTDKENNIFPCWTIVGGKYYHLDKDKQIDYNTIIDGYEIGSDGAWIQDKSKNIPKAVVLPYGFQLNAQQTIEKLKLETKSNEIRQNLKSEKNDTRMAKIKELQDKIKDIQSRHVNNVDYWTQIYENQIKELQLADQEK